MTVPYGRKFHNTKSKKKDGPPIWDADNDRKRVQAMERGSEELLTALLRFYNERAKAQRKEQQNA